MQVSESDATYEEVAPCSMTQQPAAAIAEDTDEGLYQEAGDVRNDEEDEIYQDTAAPSQRHEPQAYAEDEDFYQVCTVQLLPPYAEQGL